MTIDLERAGRVCGSNHWAEHRLFEILGAWVASTVEPRLKTMLDRHSLHHAWRAGQWWDRLPVLADVDRQALVVPTAPEPAAVMDALAELDTAVARLASVYRVVVPRLSGWYAAQKSTADPVGNGSYLRTLGIVGADLDSDWGEGEYMLQRLLLSGDAVDEAASTVGRLERLLASNHLPWG